MEDHDGFATRIARRDALAFAQWMSHCERPLRLSLASFARSVDTEAVLQEALLRVWNVAPQFVPDGEPNGLFRLGIRIARNLAISETRRNVARRKRVDRTHSEQGEDLAPDTLRDPEAYASEDPEQVADTAWAAPDPLLRRVIESCYALLAGAPRRALDARVASKGADPDEVLAERENMRLNTFLQNFTRARKQLGECLTRHGVTVPKEITA
jgi:DNA-directed RNA polymerase specialized sigma24 family protein